MHTWISKYKKEGATFSSGAEAYQDKNSLYPAELTANLTTFLTEAINQGIMVEMPTFEWDQPTHTLSVIRKTEDPDGLLEYVINGGTWDDPAFVKYSADAGWVSLGISDFTPV